MTSEERAAVHAVWGHMKPLDYVNEAGIPCLGGRPIRLSPRDRLFLAILGEAVLRAVGVRKADFVEQLDELARAKITQKRLNEISGWHRLFLPEMVERFHQRLPRYASASSASTAASGVDLK